MTEAQAGLRKIHPGYENAVDAPLPEATLAVEENEDKNDQSADITVESLENQNSSMAENIDDERMEKVIDEVFQEENMEESIVQEDETNG